jgi:hypothetical protein
MYVWLLAGLALGVVLSSLVRRIPESTFAELTFITLLSTWDEWRKERNRVKAARTDPTPQPSKLRAAAGRFSLF